MKSQTLLLAKNKRLVGLFVLAIVVILFLVIPDLVGIEISLSQRLTSLGLLAVYVLLSLKYFIELLLQWWGNLCHTYRHPHGALHASTSFEFAISSIDFNTIGLLLGMMIIVTILGETGVFDTLG